MLLLSTRVLTSRLVEVLYREKFVFIHLSKQLTIVCFLIIVRKRIGKTTWTSIDWGGESISSIRISGGKKGRPLPISGTLQETNKKKYAYLCTCFCEFVSRLWCQFFLIVSFVTVSVVLIVGSLLIEKAIAVVGDMHI